MYTSRFREQEITNTQTEHAAVILSELSSQLYQHEARLHALQHWRHHHNRVDRTSQGHDMLLPSDQEA